MIALFQKLFSPPYHIILIVIASWVGLILAEKHTERHQVSKENLNNIIFYLIITYILGGRISYILQNISAFTKTPLNIFSINLDLFDSLGGLLISSMTILIISQRQKLSVWSVLDSLTPFFAILAIGVALSHLAAGTSFGIPTNVPWSIELWSAKRHPTQIYEIFASSLIFSLLWVKEHHRHPGILFLTFTALTAISVLFISGLQADQTLIFNGLKQNQVLALVTLITSFLLFEIRYSQLKNK